MNWLDLYRELYIAVSGLMIGLFTVIAYYRLRQKTRWAKGLFFVLLSLIGFILLSMMGFAAHLGEHLTTVRIFFYPVPLICLGIGSYLITTSELGHYGHTKEDKAPDIQNN